jgi:hypothetical protein
LGRERKLKFSPDSKGRLPQNQNTIQYLNPQNHKHKLSLPSNWETRTESIDITEHMRREVTNINTGMKVGAF